MMNANMKNKKQNIKKRVKTKNNFSIAVFKLLKEDFLKAVDLTAEFLINPTGGRYRYGLGKIFNTNNYFNRSPYFEKEKDGNYSVTPKGRIKIIKDILKDKLNRGAEWNGFWWAIAFDIPEKKSGARAVLRNELKCMHFVQAQKSIWVTPYNIEKELIALFKLWLEGISDEIKIFKIEKIIDDTKLKETFGIK